MKTISAIWTNVRYNHFLNYICNEFAYSIINFTANAKVNNDI